MYYVLIRGSSYKGLDFEEREEVRKVLRQSLEAHGLRYVQYNWVWDEDDRCLLEAGKYENKEDASLLIKALESMGFEICIRTHLPGDECQESSGKSL
jgi:hypothetical protein